MVSRVARPRGGSMRAVQNARTGYSKRSQVKGWGEVLAQEERRVLEAGGPGKWANRVMWREMDFVPRVRKPRQELGKGATWADVCLVRFPPAGVGGQWHRDGRRRRKKGPNWDVAQRWNQHACQ